MNKVRKVGVVGRWSLLGGRVQSHLFWEARVPSAVMDGNCARVFLKGVQSWLNGLKSLAKF